MTADQLAYFSFFSYASAKAINLQHHIAAFGNRADARAFARRFPGWKTQ